MYTDSYFSPNLRSYKISVGSKITPAQYDFPGDYFCILIDYAFTFDVIILFRWLTFFAFLKLTLI